MHLKRTDIEQVGVPQTASLRRCTLFVRYFFLFMLLLLNGCSFGKFGKADVTPYKIKTPEGLVGLTKSQVIDRLGLPEGGIVDEIGSEYWGYHNMNNYYIVLFGKSMHKSLILKIEDNIVVSAYLVDKGESTYILAGGM